MHDCLILKNYISGGEENGDRNINGTGDFAGSLRPDVQTARHHRMGVMNTLSRTPNPRLTPFYFFTTLARNDYRKKKQKKTIFKKYIYYKNTWESEVLWLLTVLICNDLPSAKGILSLNIYMHILFFLLHKKKTKKKNEKKENIHTKLLYVIALNLRTVVYILCMRFRKVSNHVCL